MGLRLMYITNIPDVARIAENSGVDRIFVDMEYIGKDARQGGMDTVQNHHTIEDVRRIRNSVSKAQVLCRVNPIHNQTAEYSSSEEEIEGAIQAGTDILMLPYFKTVGEVEQFIKFVNGRVKTMLLVETPEAVAQIDDILKVPGIDEVHIGLNDLSLGYGMKFMFELLADGTVEKLCMKFKEKGVPYGFGGIASLGHGLLPSEYVIREHYRLGSTGAILSRCFCNTDQVDRLDKVEGLFRTGINDIRALESECMQYPTNSDYFIQNTKEVIRRVNLVEES